MTLYRRGDFRRDARSTTYGRLAMTHAVILWDALAPWLSTDDADDDGQVDVVQALGHPAGAELAAQLLIEYGDYLDVPELVEVIRDPRAERLTLDEFGVARRAVRVEGVA